MQQGLYQRLAPPQTPVLRGHSQVVQAHCAALQHRQAEPHSLALCVLHRKGGGVGNGLHHGAVQAAVVQRDRVGTGKPIQPCV
ncbi:hypothetical protein D3C72_2094300 [compost metagenome]